jgi:hypothetical protein
MTSMMRSLAVVGLLVGAGTAGAQGAQSSDATKAFKGVNNLDVRDSVETITWERGESVEPNAIDGMVS